MMVWVVVFIVVGLVLAVAAALVFREAIRLSDEPPDAVFDPDDALAWVIEHLDDRIAATLTPDDARRIVDAQMEFFRDRGVSRNGDPAHEESPVVFATDEAIAFVVERCAATGEAYLPEQVEAVMACQLDYLRFIGAIGRPAEDDAGPGV
ncbi:MAG: hypothetical protein ACXV9S_03425 [Acidimicrobiia bacterium]